ncbi:hypothetical protein JFJ09_07330 [Pseudoalteromonas arctica]|uniref:hypothetical protein n=1 Tax=Pseudoalteromonas arctica TaxID=394751 RepID=UPI001C9C0E1D|nr:hypothetical protein [Pseudoalteromonas arctica]MBZ2192027.1 hypothetical protein [Pseudoalteromonas arctica]
MFKWLDKYMDNLKSPYWEVYFWIIIIAVGIAGTVVIFADPMGLASKFGNAGSFLGGLFTIAALIVAIRAYKKNIREHHDRIILESYGELTIYFMPNLFNTIENEARFLRKDISKINKGNLIEIKEVSDKVKSRFYALKDLKILFVRKINYIRMYSNNTDNYPESFKELISIIDELLKFSFYLVSEEQNLDDSIQLENYLNWVENGLPNIQFYKKYIKRSVELEGGNTIPSDQNDLRIRLKELRDNLLKDINLKPNQF